MLRCNMSSLVLTTILTAILLCEGYVETCLRGECKSIYECEQYREILHKKLKSSEELKFLREATCGFSNIVPKVCCHSLNDQDIINNQISTTSMTEEIESFSVSTEPGPEVKSQKITNGPLQHCQETISSSAPDPKSKCCGIERRINDKIMGGDEVDIGQYPWLALIEYAKIRTPMCGGALISGKYVLTAAHCIVVDAYGRPVSVILGEYDMSHDGPDCVLLEPGVEDCTTGAVRIGIARRIIHPGFDPAKLQKPNDIGLIKLRKMAPYNYFILPICLPSADVTASPPNNLTLYVAGFGTTENNPISNIKMHVGLPFVNMTECQANYKVPGYNMNLLKTQVCAGGQGGKDSCKGDSGGPLMYENGRTFELVGVVSMGPINCGEENIPGLYTKVFDYLDWIKLNMLP